MSSQTPHIQRLLLTAFVTGIPEHKVRCISPDVGGAFGTKIFCYADMALVMFASKLVGGHPVKWVEGRRESYGSTIHGRDHITYIEIAATKAGEVTGLRVKTFANLGGRLSTIGPGIPTTLYGRILAGPYKIPNVYCEVTGVYTNTTFVDAYRGAGRPEATYVVERAMDLLADELGMDPAELRRRNFLPPDSFPYDNPSGLLTAVNGVEAVHRLGQLRAGDGQGARDGRLREHRGEEGRGEGPRQAPRDRALDVHRGLRRRAVEVDRRRRRGLGRRDVGGSNIKVHLTGKTVVTMGTQPQGQGHETTYAQIISHELGIPMDDIVVQHSDTQGTPFGYGSYGSRTSQRRHGRGPQGRGQDPRQGEALRGPHARGQRSRTSRSTAPSTGSRARPRRRRPSRRSRSRSTSRFDTPEGMEPYLDETAYHDTPTARSRSGPTSRSSRSTRRPATSTSSGTSRSTTSARRSTR